MPNVKDCPGFETFGADVQQAREAVNMSRQELAKRVGIDPRYLANIELCGTIPSVPVVMQLIRLCKLPAERYFNPGLIREDSGQATSLPAAFVNSLIDNFLYSSFFMLFSPITVPFSPCIRISSFFSYKHKTAYAIPSFHLVPS